MPQIDYSTIGIAGAIAFSMYLLYKSGLLGAWAKKLLSTINNNDNHEKRIKKIEDNDIHHIEADISEIKVKIYQIEDKISKNTIDVAVLKSKVDKLT